MSADRSTDHQLDPDRIVGQSFAYSRKGYDADEVRAYLVGLSSELRQSEAERDALSRRMAELERRATDPVHLDPSQLTALIGEETTRVLETARQAAAEIRAKAEDAAARLVRDAHADASATRDAADEYAAATRQQADQDTSAQRTAADEYQASTRAAADDYDQATRATAEAETAAERTAADEYDRTTRDATDAEVASVRAEAQTEVDALRGQAESVLGERTAEAEAEAAAIRAAVAQERAAAEAEVAALRQTARDETDALRADVATEVADQRAALHQVVTDQRAAADAEVAATQAQAVADAEAEVEQAREQGREMVEEARAYRERVLADLADRRRTARAQLEHLRATRDGLLGAVGSIDERVADARRDLEEALPDLRPIEEPEPPAPSPRPVVEPTDAVPTGVEDAAPGEPTSAPPEADASTDPVADADPAPEPSGDESPEPGPEPEAVVDVPADDAVQDEAAGGEPAAIDEPANVGADVEGEAGPVHDAAADADEGSGSEADSIFARLRAETADGPEDASHGPADVEPAAVAAEPVEAVAVLDVAAEVDAGTDPELDDDAADAADAEEPVDADVALLERRDAATDEIEHHLARRLKRVLSDEQNDVLDALRRTHGRARGQASSEGVIPDVEAHTIRYVEAITPDFEAAAAAGASFFGAASGRAPKVSDIADELASELVRQLRSRLDRAFEGGGDEQEIGERIRAGYREWKTQRIADTSRHFVLAAFTRGVYHGAPADRRSRWLVDDGGPCPDCDDNALAGATTKGEPFPTGDLHPPAHPGCRCLIVPAEA